MIYDTYLDSVEMALALYISGQRDLSMGDAQDRMGFRVKDARLHGVYGEMVFSKMFNVAMQFHDLATPWDVIYRGWAIDVKCSDKPNLVINTDCVRDGVDVFAYVHHLKDNHFVYKGAISKKRLIAKHEPIQSTYSECYFVSPDNLTLDIPARTPQGTSENTNEVSSKQRQRHPARKPH